MKKFLNILGVMVIGMMAAACVKEVRLTDDIRSNEQSPEIRFRIGAASNKATRAGTDVASIVDDKIDNAFVLVLKQGDTAGEYVYDHSAAAPNFASAQNVAQFTMRLKAIDGPVKLLVVANYTPALEKNLPAKGASEDALRTALAGTVYGNDINEDVVMGGVVPMTGEKELLSIVQAPGTVIEIPMVRSMARVDVEKTLTSASKPFKVTSVNIMNANSHVQVFPSNSALATGSKTKVVSPSIPVASGKSIDNKQYIGVTDSGTNLTYTDTFPYVPEVEAVSTSEDKMATTCVIVGGEFDGDDFPTYYRVDFNQDVAGKFGEILRNYRYMFTIREVSRRGDLTPEEAVQNADLSRMTVLTEVWDQSSSDVSLGNADPFLKIGKSSILLDLSAGSADSSMVKSNVNFSYEVWQNGYEVTNIANLQDFSLNVVDVSTPGAPYSYNFVAATLTANSNDEMRSFEVRVFWSDGTQIDTINFEQRHSTVHILSMWDGAYGSLGVWSQGGAKTPDGFVQGVRNTLINPTNFGPNGIVKIDGVTLDEVQESDPDLIPVNNAIMQLKLDWADIFVLHYNTTLNASQITMVKEWMKKGSHVLWVCGEGDDTNLAVRQDPDLGGGLVWHQRSELTSSMSKSLVQGTIDLLESQMTLTGTASTTLTPGSDLAKGVAAPLTTANTPFVAGPFGTATQGDATDSSNDGICEWFSPGTDSNIIPVIVMPMMVTVKVTEILLIAETKSQYASECMMLGVDPKARIVYMGDSQLNDDFYNYSTSLYHGNMKKMMDNTWAWAVKTSMGIE